MADGPAGRYGRHHLTVAPCLSPQTAVQKRVTIEQLKPGMYIHDLGTDWMSHGFIRSRFTLKDEEQIAKIRETGIRALHRHLPGWIPHFAGASAMVIPSGREGA